MITDPIRVAVLDDDASVRAGLVRLLKSADMAAHAYESSSEFFEAVAKTEPDILLLDLHGLEMSGLDVAKHLNRQGVCIPAIVITGSDESSREACLNAGVAAYLNKPLDPDRLIRLIEEIVQSSRAGAAQCVSG